MAATPLSSAAAPPTVSAPYSSGETAVTRESSRAAEFSFLLGVLAVSGAAVRELSRVTAVSPELHGALMVGGAAALLSGVAAIWLFVRLLRAGSIHRFAFYVWGLGAAYLLWLSLGAR